MSNVTTHHSWIACLVVFTQFLSYPLSCSYLSDMKPLMYCTYSFFSYLDFSLQTNFAKNLTPYWVDHCIMNGIHITQWYEAFKLRRSALVSSYWGAFAAHTIFTWTMYMSFSISISGLNCLQQDHKQITKIKRRKHFSKQKINRFRHQ